MGWLSRLTDRFAAQAPATDEQILARLLPMWQSARPLPQPHDYRAFAQDGYRRNAIIFACITEISTSAAEPTLQALTTKGKEPILLPVSDPLSMLLAQPNPEQSRYELLSLLTTHLHVAGNAYLHKVRARNGKPVQLWPLRPDRVEIKPGSNGLIESYAYSVSGQPTFIPAEDVVHFTMHPDPLDDYYGLSPIAVLARFGDLDNSATDFLRAFFLNAGVPGGLLTFKSGRVEKNERERIRQSWRDQFSTSKGWHDVGVMDADVSYQELGSVPRKLDLSTVWGVTESRICMVFGVPAVLVGAWIGLQNSTFANYETAQKSLWQETLSPFYVRMADKFTMGVASEFGPDRLIRFDLSQVRAFQEAQSVKEERALKAWDAGLVTMNQANAALGYPDSPDGNVRKLSTLVTLVPAGTNGQSQQRRAMPHLETHALPKFIDNAPDDPFYLAVHKIADRLTPQLRDAFLRGVLAMDGGIDQETLIAAVEAGDMERAFAAIPFEAFADALKTGGGDVLLQAIAEAGASAALTLQDTHGLTMTFDLTNPRAQQFAATQTATMVTQVTEGTKDAIRAIIERGFSEGLTPQQMAMEIRQIVGLTDRQALAVANFRASLEADGLAADLIDQRVGKYAAAQLRYRGTMIARQETLTASNAGQRELWMQASDKGLLPTDQKRAWVLTPDGRLCTTICEPMDGVEVGLNEPWQTSAGPVMIPQQSHVQCLPGNTQVTPGGRIAAVSRRWYDGDLITIRTASGKQLSCTPNHPILTDGGWRSAHDLGIGGYVISGGSREGMLASDMDDQHMPASIEQIAEAFRQLPHVFSTPMPLTAEDFHGDGEGSDVAIVWTNRLLRDEMNRSFNSLGDHIEEQSFGGINMETEPLIEESATALSVQTMRCSFDGPVSGSNLAASLEGGHLRPFECFSRTAPTLNYTIISQPFRDDASTDVISLSQGVTGHTLPVQAKNISDRDDGAVLPPRRLRTSDSDVTRSQPIRDRSTVNVELPSEIGSGTTGEIFLDEIIKIDRVPFSGHVYNLHTEFEFYVANGIITHNCRCAQGLVTPT